VDVRRNSTGKEFHAVDAETENELSDVVQRSPDATRIAVDRQNRVDRLHLDRFSRFCTVDRTASLYFTMGYPFLP